MKSYLRYRAITISFYDCNVEIIIVTYNQIHAKMPQKPNFESKKIGILGENGMNSKLKHRQVHNSILSGRFAWWPVQEEIVAISGTLGMYDNHTWQLIVFNSKVQT